ncbi:hypothetical protein ZIOFF_058322 [Zingiber officinale]|uniref:Uncharacterized protein n=1 Tax=Zingiber officinale TaxID=94328 RepID=A0A8J5F9F3_ZINOF|nr:hypothetical protein ZIOFF_058322 [Zingiber officinale]
MRWFSIVPVFQILGIGVIFFGIWMGVHHDQCRRSLTLPVMGLGASILLISFIGFLGAWKNVVVFLWVVSFGLATSLSCHVVLDFDCDHGFHCSCVMYNTAVALSVNANHRTFSVKTLMFWFIITNSGSGHAVNGLRCGYPAVNASYYDLSYHPVSKNKDCKLAGVAQYMKMEWRIVAIFNVILFVVLSFVYFIGCCARRNVSRIHTPKIPRRR